MLAQWIAVVAFAALSFGGEIQASPNRQPSQWIRPECLTPYQDGLFTYLASDFKHRPNLRAEWVHRAGQALGCQKFFGLGIFAAMAGLDSPLNPGVSDGRYRQIVTTFENRLKRAGLDHGVPTMSEYVLLTGRDYNDMPVIKVSELIERVRAERGEDAEKRLVLAFIDDMGLKLPKSYLVSRSRAALKYDDHFGEREVREMDALQKRYLGGKLGLLDVYKDLDHQLDFTIKPKELDKLIQVPLSDVALFQSLFLITSMHRRQWGKGTAPIPYSLESEDADWARVDFTQKACARPTWEPQPAFDDDLGVVRGRQAINDFGGAYGSVTPCYHVLSKKLEYVVNRLKNTVKQEQAVSVSLKFIKGTEVVTNYEELLAALGKHGFTVEITNSRRLANFSSFSYYSEPERRWYGVRQVAWTQLTLDNQELNYPSEHSDISLLIHDGKRRYAQLAWYFGADDDETHKYEGNAVLWRTDTELEWRWAFPQVNFSIAYAPKHAREALQFFYVTADVARGVKAVNDKYRTSHNGYGLLTCSDGAVLALGKMDEVPGVSLAPGERLTGVFPFWRVGRKDILRSEVQGQIFKHGGYKPAAIARLKEVYPADQELLADPVKMRARLQASFPIDARVGDMLQLLPEFQETLNRVQEMPKAVGRVWLSNEGHRFVHCCVCEMNGYDGRTPIFLGSSRVATKSWVSDVPEADFRTSSCARYGQRPLFNQHLVERVGKQKIYHYYDGCHRAAIKGDSCHAAHGNEEYRGMRDGRESWVILPENAAASYRR